MTIHTLNQKYSIYQLFFNFLIKKLKEEGVSKPIKINSDNYTVTIPKEVSESITNFYSTVNIIDDQDFVSRDLFITPNLYIPLAVQDDFILMKRGTSVTKRKNTVDLKQGRNTISFEFFEKLLFYFSFVDYPVLLDNIPLEKIVKPVNFGTVIFEKLDSRLLGFNANFDVFFFNKEPYLHFYAVNTSPLFASCISTVSPLVLTPIAFFCSNFDQQLDDYYFRYYFRLQQNFGLTIQDLDSLLEANSYIFRKVSLVWLFYTKSLSLWGRRITRLTDEKGKVINLLLQSRWGKLLEHLSHIYSFVISDFQKVPNITTSPISTFTTFSIFGKEGSSYGIYKTTIGVLLSDGSQKPSTPTMGKYFKDLVPKMVDMNTFSKQICRVIFFTESSDELGICNLRHPDEFPKCTGAQLKKEQVFFTNAISYSNEYYTINDVHERLLKGSLVLFLGKNVYFNYIVTQDIKTLIKNKDVLILRLNRCSESLLLSIFENAFIYKNNDKILDLIKVLVEYKPKEVDNTISYSLRTISEEYNNLVVTSTKLNKSSILYRDLKNWISKDLDVMKAAKVYTKYFGDEEISIISSPLIVQLKEKEISFSDLPDKVVLDLLSQQSFLDISNR